MKMKSRSHRYDINRPTSRYGHNIVNIKNVLVGWSWYVSTNTLATLEAQFMKVLSKTEAELKKTVLLKEAPIRLYHLL